jgi:hypothetical protein
MLRVSFKALINAAGSAPSVFFDCFIDSQFQRTLFPIVAGSASLRAVGLTIVERLVFMLSGPRSSSGSCGAASSQL